MSLRALFKGISTMEKTFRPEGPAFKNPYTNRLMLVTKGPLAGWLAAQNHDGQWVTIFNVKEALEKAAPKEPTADEIRNALAEGG